jgi:M6 family metalloprotease-like protein
LTVLAVLAAGHASLAGQTPTEEPRGTIIYMEPPQVEGLALPADFEATRLGAAEALGIRSPEEMVGPAGTIVPQPAEGERRLIVIPALFSDSPDPPVSADALRRVLFDGPAEPGTLTEYYADVSGGRVTITGQVAPWVRTSTTRLDAAGELNGHGWLGDSLVAYVRSAVAQADPEVDFAQFDDDGPDGIPDSGDDDGVVDHLIIEFPDIAGSCGGPGIWPVAGFGGTLAVSDDMGASGEPIRVTSYAAVSAVDCSGSPEHAMAVLAHEVGHLFGVGDYYERYGGIEPEYRRWLVGCFGVMGAGSWGCGSGQVTGFGPTQMVPYTKWFLGWIDLERVQPTQDTTYELEPSQTGGRGLWVPLGPSAPAESFLIEYRPQIGFDEVLPAGGVLIYHLDWFHGFRQIPPGAPNPAFLHLVEADGDNGLLIVQGQGGDRGEASDVFARDGAVDSLTATTTPSSRSHQGDPSALTIHSIQVLDGKARIRLTYEPGFGAVNENIRGGIYALSTLEGQFEIVGGTPPFQAHPAPGAETPEGLEITLQDRMGFLGGQLAQAGYFQFDLNLQDDNGLTSTMVVPLRVADLPIARDTLIDAVLDPSSVDLTAEELHYLDVSGEKNGMLDVADVRAALERRQLLEPPQGGE